MAADTAGNVVVTGIFIGTLNLGSVTLTAQGYTDAFVVKYTAAGGVQWAQAFGSPLAGSLSGSVRSLSASAPPEWKRPGY